MTAKPRTRRSARDHGEVALKWATRVGVPLISMLALKQSKHAEDSSAVTASSIVAVQRDVAKLSSKDRENRQDKEIARLKEVIRLGMPGRGGPSKGRGFVGPMPDSTESPVRVVGRAIVAPFKAVWGWLKS